MEYTGERVIPDLMKPSNTLLLEHLARYQFALPYCHGRILDFACGSGYGTQLIAKNKHREVKEVVGIDHDPQSIHYAKGRYYHPKTTYVVADVVGKGLYDRLGTFDVVVSFETIEHVEDYELFMRNIHDLLVPGGTLILSTPFGQGIGKETKEPFHVHQMTELEFKQLFYAFTSVEFYHQRNVLIEKAKGNVHYPLGIAVATK